MDNNTLAVKIYTIVHWGDPLEITIGKIEMILDKERPENAEQKAERINNEIEGIEKVLRDERRPEQVQRYKDSIKLKKKELIRLKKESHG